MNAYVLGHFRVKRCSQHFVLPRCGNKSLTLGKNFHTCACFVYVGGSNKGHWHILHAGKRAAEDGAAELSAIGVAFHRDIHDGKVAAAVVFNIGG